MTRCSHCGERRAPNNRDLCNDCRTEAFREDHEAYADAAMAQARAQGVEPGPREDYLERASRL